MSTQLIDLNQDLKKLKDDGYSTSIVESNLVVAGIPYVNAEKKILFGAIFCPLTISGESIGAPQDHTVYFAGEYPCNQLGQPSSSFVNSATTNKLNSEIVGNYYLSSKPVTGSYSDFYTKMTKYIELLSNPAKSIDPGISAQYSSDYTVNEISVFKYADTHTARANLTNASQKLRNQKIAIVGLGGTGSYLLDFVSKTPVKQISIFDGDDILNHNAFRMPGAMTLNELRERPSKSSFFKEKYEALRNEIVAYDQYLNEANVDLLGGHDFVFLAIDKAEAKRTIISYLMMQGIPFIDLGMGVTLVNDSVRGTVRRTLVTPENQTYLNKIAMSEAADQDIYAQNIQISELNALNAVQAVITWKKMNGFYATEDTFFNSTFIIDEEEFGHEA